MSGGLTLKTSEFSFRTFQPDDLEQCLAIFDSNCPQFFSVNEREKFVRYLIEDKLPYFVLQDKGGTMVACGGFLISNKIAELTWGMTERSLHGRGLGSLLFNFRLAEIRKVKAKALKMDTSQHSLGFYLKQGFQLKNKIPDGYDKGLDRFDLWLEMPES